MDTLKYILDKYNLKEPSDDVRLPIEIPNMGRDQLAYLFKELGFKVGVEVGVRDGTYSLVLCEANPQLKLYGVDPYISYKGYRDITKQSSFDRVEEEAREKLVPHARNYVFLKKFSVDAVREFADNSLDFVYIDGNHDFYNVTTDIELWSKKVRPGGIISGDDYVKYKNDVRIHVYYVVNGYTEAWKIKPWFVLGRNAIEDGEIRDHGRSWMWVKQ